MIPGGRDHPGNPGRHCIKETKIDLVEIIYKLSKVLLKHNLHASHLSIIDFRGFFSIHWPALPYPSSLSECLHHPGAPSPIGHHPPSHSPHQPSSCPLASTNLFCLCTFISSFTRTFLLIGPMEHVAICSSQYDFKAH